MTIAKRVRRDKKDGSHVVNSVTLYVWMFYEAAASRLTTLFNYVANKKKERKGGQE